MAHIPDNWRSERTTTLTLSQTVRDYQDGHRTIETEGKFRTEECWAPGHAPDVRPAD